MLDWYVYSRRSHVILASRRHAADVSFILLEHAHPPAHLQLLDRRPLACVRSQRLVSVYRRRKNTASDLQQPQRVPLVFALWSLQLTRGTVDVRA